MAAKRTHAVRLSFTDEEIIPFEHHAKRLGLSLPHLARLALFAFIRGMKIDASDPKLPDPAFIEMLRERLRKQGEEFIADMKKIDFDEFFAEGKG